MKHEKIIKREDGSKVKLIVNFFEYRDMPEFIVSGYICNPRKHKFIELHNGDDYQYRALSIEDRKKYDYDKILKYATEQEIYDTKIELWEKLKPVKF